MDHDQIEITIMDDLGETDELKIHSYDDVVYITQYNEEWEADTIIEISPRQWEELMAAIHSPEGTFFLKRKGIR